MKVEYTETLTPLDTATFTQDARGRDTTLRSMPDASDGAGALPRLPEQTMEVGKRALTEAARARVAAIREHKAAAAAKSASTSGSGEAAKSPDRPAEAAGAVAAAGAAPVVTDQGDDAGGDEADGAETEAPVSLKPGEQPEGEAKPEEQPDAAAAEPEEVVALRGTVDRQTKLLEQARAELEQAKKGQTDDYSARAKLIRDSEDEYLEGPAAAVRKYVAGRLGVDDLKSAEVDQELDDLIADLISARNGVALDAAHEAKRKQALLQRAWNQDKKRQQTTSRETDEQKQRTQRDEQLKGTHAIIAKHLDGAKTDYPHLLALSQELDGTKPEEKVWDAIQKGVQLGVIDRNQSDEALFKAGAAVVEKLYRARAERLRGALPATGTAAPKPSPATKQAGAADADVKQGRARQGHGSRTITNADASVAPAGTGKQPAASETRLSRDPDERRRQVIAKHFPDHPSVKRLR